MTAADIKDRVEELLRLPYRKVIQGDPEEGFLAEAPELPGCFTAGETEAEALDMLRDAMAGWFESQLARGLPVPPPQPAAARFSGRILVRMPATLHRRLAERAADEGVSINQWVVSVLSRGT